MQDYGIELVRHKYFKPFGALDMNSENNLPVSQQWALMKRDEEYPRTREPCPNVAAKRLARSDAAAVNPDISWSSWSDTLVLKPDTVLQTNLCKRLSQRINPSYCPRRTFTNNIGTRPPSSGGMYWSAGPDLTRGASATRSFKLLY